MSGKFVSIEEAARLLGATADEVNRLVDRKKLFPMRDGATLKFKVDEIERLVASQGEQSSASLSGPPDLDLDLDDLAIGAAVEPGPLAPGQAPGGGSQTVLHGGVFGDDDLALESIIAASSPSLAPRAKGPASAAGIPATSDEPLSLDLSDVAAGGGSSPAVGSQVTGSFAGISGAGGSGFGAPKDSGLSLEDPGVAVSGIDLDIGPMPGSGVTQAGGSLMGEAFELGDGAGEEESASVVIATEESGDSSFFSVAGDDSASVSFGDSSVGDASSSVLGGPYVAPAAEMTFSGWQIAGLTCCALLLLAGGFVMYDLAWVIRAPQGEPYSAPLLNALSETFGWRR